MSNNYTLHLNLFPIDCDLPTLGLYRAARNGNESLPDDPGLLGAYSLPDLNSDGKPLSDDWGKYWISTSDRAGFTPFAFQPRFNPDLTKRLLFEGLQASVLAKLEPTEYQIKAHGFLKEVRFTIASFPEGQQQVIVAPYYLRSQALFGFLMDFHFSLRPNTPFNRRVQQLSLSLDAKFKRNLDFLVDRLKQIKAFLSSKQAKVFPFKMPGSQQYVGLRPDFTQMPAFQLAGKTYLFADGRSSRSQYVGVKEIGPVELPTQNPTLVFVFRESDRDSARLLAKALIGNEPKFDFPGFHKVFRTNLAIDAHPILLADYSQEEMDRAVIELQQRAGPVMPVLVMRRSEEAYLCHKAVFARAGISSQVCTIENIEDDYSLKWSIANIALQIFCKLGGKPWRVKPTDSDSLIVGISQSHKIVDNEGKASVERYFAFSVLTDSSGLFQEIEVLGNDSNHQSYLTALRENLTKILKTSATQFRRIVIHTTFKLRQNEMQAIHDAVESASKEYSGKCHFAVVKINQNCRFLATNRAVNSRVPYEGSFVKLSHNEYLIWFEGVFRDKPTVNKALPGPTHVQFLRGATEDGVDHDVVLQDLVNLSGANWRGFNAKSTPVSIFYCHLVADLIHDFHHHGLPLPAFKDLNPWFL